MLKHEVNYYHKIASNNHLWNIKHLSSYCPINGAGIWGPFFKGLFLPQKSDLAPHFETVYPPFIDMCFLIKIKYAPIALYGPHLCCNKPTKI